MFTRHYGVWPKELPKTLMLPKTSIFTNLAVSALRYPDQHGHYFLRCTHNLPAPVG